MSKRDEECTWTHWAIEYKHGDFSYVLWDTMRGLRKEAWRAWEKDVEQSASDRMKDREYLRRRTRHYRAVKVCAHKLQEKTP